MNLFERITCFAVRWKSLWATWLALVGVIGSVAHLGEIVVAGVREIGNSSDFKTIWSDIRHLIKDHEGAKEALS